MSTVVVQPGYHTELIDGREVEKPLPKKLHARSGFSAADTWYEAGAAVFTPVSFEAALEKLSAPLGESSTEISLAEMWSELD